MKTLRLLTVTLLLTLISLPSLVRAQEEARAAWLVTRFDIAANSSAGGANERALTVRASLAARNVGQGMGRTFTVRLNPAAEIKSAAVGEAPATFTSRTEARSKLQQVTVTLPSEVPANGAVTVALEYRLPVANNTGLAAISAEGAQFLPLSHWYPSPNTEFSPRGADTAPVRLTANATGGEMVVASGKSAGPSFEQTLQSQPFFLTGRWDAVEGAGEAAGVSALLPAGASADERRRGEALISLAAGARAFYASLLGAQPDTPLRLVAVRRGAGFNAGGTLLLDAAVFRRSKTDSATAMLIAEAVARTWIGGATGVQGEGQDVLREGLSRYLATLFLEKQFGRETAEAEIRRIAAAYAPVARRDAPLMLSTPFNDTHFASVSNKGAMVWRLISERITGRENFFRILRRELEAARGGKITLAALRTALGERTDEATRSAFDALFNQPTDTDLLVGLPQQRGGEWVSALRNIGSLAARVTVVAVTQSGERIPTQASVPARDFGEARFKTTSPISYVVVDPERLYPQLDYGNDVVPRAPTTEEAVAEASREFAQQKYERVVEVTRAALQRDPLAQEARVWLGGALVELNRLDEGERELKAALDSPLPSPSAISWGNIFTGNAAVKRKQHAEALRRYDEAAHSETDYASLLTARAARLRVEGAPASLDESARTFVAQLDQAIQSGRKVGLDALIVSGELTDFIRGIVSNQPEAWQTRVLRTEALGSQRMAVDVFVNARILGKEHAGSAVLLLLRTPAGWRLLAMPIFEVRQKTDAT